MDKIVGLCKRRGFVFQSAEIYGGFRSAYDFGPLGVNLLRNVKNAWWETMVQRRDDVVGIDASILSPPAVWQASGHLANFTDPLVDCLHCRQRWRQDKIGGVCPNCGSTEFTEARAFNLMFKTHAGPIEDEGAVTYLRPETAQGMFINFANVLQTTRKRPPFGIAQIGKSFRNEITPQNFVFRTREFEQMEMEYFVPPAEADEWFGYWLEERYRWYTGLGIPESELRLRHHGAEELSHYSTATADVEFRFPWGWDELEGIANRTDFDLRAHSLASGERLEYVDQASGERYVPYVIEPAAGATRTMMAFLLSAYAEDEIGGELRTVLRLHPRACSLPGGGPSAFEEGAARASRPGGAGRPPAPSDVRLRRDPVHRPSVPSPGRDRDAVVCDRRLRVRHRQSCHHPGPGHHGSGPGAPRAAGHRAHHPDAPELTRPLGDDEGRRAPGHSSWRRTGSTGSASGGGCRFRSRLWKPHRRRPFSWVVGPPAE